MTEKKVKIVVEFETLKDSDVDNLLTKITVTDTFIEKVRELLKYADSLKPDEDTIKMLWSRLDELNRTKRNTIHEILVRSKVKSFKVIE